MSRRTTPRPRKTRAAIRAKPATSADTGRARSEAPSKSRPPDHRRGTRQPALPTPTPTPWRPGPSPRSSSSHDYKPDAQARSATSAHHPHGLDPQRPGRNQLPAPRTREHLTRRQALLEPPPELLVRTAVPMRCSRQTFNLGERNPATARDSPRVIYIGSPHLKGSAGADWTCLGWRDGASDRRVEPRVRLVGQRTRSRDHPRSARSVR